MAAPLATAKINYSVYVVNGPTLNDGSTEPEEAGFLHYNDFDDNNNNKGIGGQLDFLPFYDSSLEVGFSALVAKAGDAGPGTLGQKSQSINFWNKQLAGLAHGINRKKLLIF